MKEVEKKSETNSIIKIPKVKIKNTVNVPSVKTKKEDFNKKELIESVQIRFPFMYD